MACSGTEAALLGMLAGDGLQLQDEDERSEEASTVEEHIEQVDVSIVLIGNGEEVSIGMRSWNKGLSFVTVLCACLPSGW